jgi:hypothetical protein
MTGNFRGKIEIVSPPGPASHYILNSKEIVGYFNGFNISAHYQVGFFDKEGVVTDTIPSIITKPKVSFDDIYNIQVYRGTYRYGNWGRTGAIVISMKDDKVHIIPENVPRLWRSGENIRFKEDFIDTVYTVSGRTLVPSVVFNMGKYTWPVEDMTGTSNTKGRIFIGDVAENSDFIFFQCIKGMYSDEPVLYHGLYHKKTGNTKLGENSKPIQDDLTGFMPFIPFSISTSGEFVSFLEAFSILEWLEEHPEAKNSNWLPFLKNLTDDMNPVIVLID